MNHRLETRIVTQDLSGSTLGGSIYRNPGTMGDGEGRTASVAKEDALALSACE